MTLPTFNLIKNIMDKYRSRKFILSVFIQLASTVALFTGFLDSGNYAGISSANIAAYSFANAANLFSNNRRFDHGQQKETN